MSEAVNYSVTIYPKNKKETEDFKKNIDELRHELDEDPEISEYPSYGTKTQPIGTDPEAVLLKKQSEKTSNLS